MRMDAGVQPGVNVFTGEIDHDEIKHIKVRLRLSSTAIEYLK